jgi:hypothetical protein
MHRILLSYGVQWIVETLFFLRGKESGSHEMVDALAAGLGKDALLKKVTEVCKKESGGQRKPMPCEALKVRQLMRANPGMKPGEAIRRAIGINSTHRAYQDVNNAVKNHAEDLDNFLDAPGIVAGNPFEGLPDPILDADELLKQRL